jgi:AcrR family transcriptional regulator
MARKSSNSSATSGSTRREYRSPLRDAQAQDTRRRIVAAAAECFRTLGYSRTTLALIGREAGVSAESVAANGPKGALLLAAFEHAFTGREGDDPMTGRDDLAGMLRIEDVDEMLAAFAEFAVALQRDGIGMWRALQDASLQDDTVAALYRGLMERRRLDHELAIEALRARGLVRADRTVAQLAGTLALLNGFDPYQLLVLDFGWSEDDLREWYVDEVRRTILIPREDARA